QAMQHFAVMLAGPAGLAPRVSGHYPNPPLVIINPHEHLLLVADRLMTSLEITASARRSRPGAPRRALPGISGFRRRSRAGIHRGRTWPSLAVLVGRRRRTVPHRDA